MDIKGFFGEYRFLSNFWDSDVVLDDVTYPTIENAFQAAKTLDVQERKGFVSLHPGQAKRLGRSVQLRNDWEKIKGSIMEDLVRQKFSKGELKDKLLATGDCYLEETNHWHDTYWGVCNGVGENKLGKILMKIRKELSSHA